MYIITFIFSIWQSILFWEKEPGISVILFIFPFLLFLIKYLEKNDKIKNKKAKIIIIPILLLASTFFLFNNRFLIELNMLVLPILTIIMIMELLCYEFTLEKIVNNVLNFIMKPIGYFGLVGKKILKKITKENYEKKHKSKDLKRLLKSLLISAPILFLVLILLLTADSDFANIFNKPFDDIVNIINKIQYSDIVYRVIMIIFTFFYFTGFIENIILTKDIERNNKEVNKKDSLSIKITFAALNVMYLLFCIVQIRTMYKIYLMHNNNIDYSYYARQGFFQLMIVSLINIITILKSKSKCYIQDKYIKTMGLIMIFLTSIILISSFVKMYLYEQRFGFTELRIFVFFAQITEGILLIPTAIYVLDKKIKLTKIYFTIVITMYVILNFINVDRIIAKKDVDMYLARGSYSENEAYFLTSLSVDAIPETIRLFKTIEEDKYINILEQIEKAANTPIDEYTDNDTYSKYYKDENERALIKGLKEIQNELNNNKKTWQEFNLSTYKARKILEKNLTTLKKI